MASKVEILGGQLDGSVLDNAASESTLRELVDAIKKLDSTTAKNAKAAKAAGGGGGASGLDDLSKDAKSAGKEINSTFSKLGAALGKSAEKLGKFGNTFDVLGKNIMSGNNNLSGFTSALAQIPGPLGMFAAAITGSISALEDMQKTQRMLSSSGASFNNSLLDMRIAAAESGLSLEQYADFVKSNAQGIAGLGDTITEGAQKLSALGKAVGDSGLDEQFMKLGMSAQGARMAAMRFTSELVKGDKVRSASSNELASASLSYEKDLDLLAKQTGRSKDELRSFADGMIKKSGAMLFSFAGMAPGVQASMKTIMNTVGNTMGDGAATAMADLVSGAAAPSSEASAMFQSQVPGAVKAFKDMKDVANDTSLSEEQRRAKLDMLQAKAQGEQLKFLQSEQGKFMMQNKSKLSPAQREFVDGLEKNAASLAAQGIDINKASAADIEASIAAKRAEQERQGALDAGMNRFQGLMTNIGSMLQTGFFKVVKEGFNLLFSAVDAVTPTFRNIARVAAMVGDELGMIGSSFMNAMQPVVDGFTELLTPITDAIGSAFSYLGEVINPLSTTFKDVLWPAITGVSDFIQQNMTPILAAMGIGLSVMYAQTMLAALTSIPSLIMGMASAIPSLIAMGVGALGTIPGLIAMAAGLIAANLPIVAFVAGVAALAAGFIYLKKNGWEFGTVIEAMKDNLKGLFLILQDGFLSVLEKITFGDANKKIKEAQADIASERALLQEKENARDKQRAKVAEERKAVDEKVVAQNKDTRAAKAAARDQEDAAKAKKDAIKETESADAMERSKARALKGMRELAGITSPAAQGGSVAVGPQTAPGMKMQGLGRVAAQFESGGNAGTVSTGHGDAGGKSYGAFQLSSKTGDVDKFLQKSGYADKFKGMSVGSKEFDDQWKALAKDDKGFGEAQQAHAKTTHYDPQMAKLQKAGVDLSGKGSGVQEAVMSTANQYGANTSVITDALKGKDTAKMSDKEIIDAIQDYKAASVKTKFRSSSEAVQAGVAKRIEQERQALYQAGGESATAPGTAVAAAKPGVAGGTAPKGSAAVAATAQATTVDQAAKDKATADQAAKEKADKEKAAQTQTAGAATNPITEVITSLNSNIASLAMLQGKAVSIAEQQLRATQGLSRDAYKAV